MKTKHLYGLVLLLALLSQVTGLGQDQTALQAQQGVAETELDPQLKINRDALLKGSVEAATVMLFNANPQVRQILLDVLKQTENAPARMAICRALSQARAEQKTVEGRQDFAEPLLAILAGKDDTLARLAAEATLIFDYSEVRQELEATVTDANLPVTARLNVIYALGLYPRLNAAIQLVKLVDDPNSRVANAAQVSVQSLGLPVGQDVESRKKIIDELKGQGEDAFLRNRLIRQRTEIRRLNTELDAWRSRYSVALDKLCNGITDDAAKGEFFAEYLSGSETVIKLWALAKLDSLRQGTNKTPMTPKLEQILLNLISDPDRNVRLKTASLLNLMRGELNSAQRLLQQLEIEKDNEVKTELFVAVGWACYYASLPNSPFKIPSEIRIRTLQWAAEFLSEKDQDKALKGADVIRKLLEQNGLTAAEADNYLNLLAKKYDGLKNVADRALRGGLLSAMARLCSAQSVHKAEAQKLFRPFFETALNDQADLVREAAVDGLINIDKAAALSRLRKDFVNDPSSIIRRKVIDLVADGGGQEDLLWLSEKLGTTEEGQQAWQAMLEIFKRSGSKVIALWVEKLDSQPGQYKLSDGQRTSFLETAEQKAIAENMPELLKDVRAKLATIYSKTGQFERAAERFEFLYNEAAKTPAEKRAILPDLLDVYLRWPKTERVAELVQSQLQQGDLDPNSAVVRSIENYLSKPPAGADTNLILKTLSEIKIPIPKSRPMWREQLKRWTETVSEAVESDKLQRSAKSS